MGEVPGWMREQLEVEGWVAAESLETFDVHLGRRYPNRAQAVQQALAGDALLSSRGKASLSREVEGEVVIGRLRRSAQPTRSGEAELMFVYSLDSIERHAMPPRKVRPGPAPSTGPRGSRPWTCPGCEEVFLLPPEEPDLSEDQVHCPECGEPPSQFTPGQIVRVRGRPAGRSRLGVIDEPVQTDCVDPESRPPDIAHGASARWLRASDDPAVVDDRPAIACADCGKPGPASSFTSATRARHKSHRVRGMSGGLESGDVLVEDGPL